jgi:hypothetical protein
MEEEMPNERLDNAIKALSFARESAREWQLRVLTAQALAVAAIGGVKVTEIKADLQSAVIPWIAVAMFATTATMIYLATGYLKTAAYWQAIVDKIQPEKDFAGYQKVVAGHYWGPTALLGLIPGLVLAIAVGLPAFIEAAHSGSRVREWTLIVLLVASIGAFVANLGASGTAERLATAPASTQ